MEYELEFTMNEKTTYQRYYDYNLAALFNYMRLIIGAGNKTMFLFFDNSRKRTYQFFKFAQIMTKNGFLALKWYWQSHCMSITWNVNGRTKLKICRSLNDIFSKTFYFGRNFSHFTDLYTKFKCFYYYSKFLILLMFCLLFIDCLF